MPKEEQLRLEFLNPFFESLGWDMDKTLDTIQNRNWGSVSLFPLKSVTDGDSDFRTLAMVEVNSRLQKALADASKWAVSE